MERNGDALKKPTQIQSTVKDTCIEAKTVQESLWKLVMQQWQILQQQLKTSHQSPRHTTLLLFLLFLPCPCLLNPNSSTNFATMTNTDYRRNSYVYGLKEEVDEHTFFSEPSGTMRSFSGSSVDDSWQLAPLIMSSSSSKQRNFSGLQSEYSYLQLQSLTDHNPKQNKQDANEHSYIKYEMTEELEKGEPQKTVHRFFDEWPPKHRDSWLDLDDKSSNSSSVSTTRLSISIPSTSHDFSIFNSRAHNGTYSTNLLLIVIIVGVPLALYSQDLLICRFSAHLN
ncbi:growth-regulating factor 1-like isoform X1 [Gossypium australe]|uniref:Growth-regulating factor 1-like isoform X1 n=1 Tax=Gossypium australe TaxID=47621 RepID=A0A5B6VT53_9ROSI|nr:growth-regulating factor 1-like isoform X1 [Gossypium australe]